MVNAVHLHAGGVSVVFALYDDRPPAIAHWGASLGDLSRRQVADVVSSAVVEHRSMPGSPHLPAPVVGAGARGWTGTPGIRGHRAGEDWSPRLAGVTTTVDGSSLRVRADDQQAGLGWEGEWLLDEAGVLRVRHRVINLVDAPYDVQEVLVALPVPGEAGEVLDLSGRWARERDPQRHPFVHGTFRREGRHGRTGHDATLLLSAGTPGFGFRAGEVWSVHTAWSGDHVTYAERNPDGVSVVGGGELLSAGEVRLHQGESYSTPWIYAAWSDCGLDGVSARLHQHLRARPRHPRSARPVVLNTWEAVYFDHDLDKLKALADKGAQVGAERFVLDDGWFMHRRNDQAGLGDWYVDADVWPDGLGPIIQHVRALGMEFGLWVEPEMVNLDSDLARAHPDWVLSTADRTPPEWRSQQVLNLGHPDAFDHILGRLDAILTDNDIGYLKWDHNRDLVDARVHDQTVATYALIDELSRRHPGVEIESCSSGGARVDLEILARTDRVWASDCIDALERQQIERWTALLLPPELVGSHVGAPRAHTTGRRHGLAFRAITAMFGHFGIEWDLASAGEEDLAELAGWVAIYKEQRGLVHSGQVVRMDPVDPGVWVRGTVAQDRRAALFAVAAVQSRVNEPPPLVRLAGLDARTTYRGWLLAPGGEGDKTTFDLPGSVLMNVGWRAPPLDPETAVLLRLDAVGLRPAHRRTLT